MGIETKNDKRKMRLEITKIGFITFGIMAIYPIIQTIIFFVVWWRQISDWTFTFDYYGDLSIGIDFALVITIWLVCTLPLTITNVIGKRILYTEKPNWVFVLPILTIGLVIVFVSIGLWIAGGLSGSWL